MIKQDPNSYLDDLESNYKKGLDYQREKFKNSKFTNDYDSMCDSIENLKSEIKPKVLGIEQDKKLEKIEKICDKYRTIESQFIKNTPQGKQVVFPGNIHYQVNKALTKAYELIIELLDLLKLL